MKLIIYFFFILFAFSVSSCAPSPERENYLRDLRDRYGSGDKSNWPPPILHPAIDSFAFQDIGVIENPEYPESNPYSSDKELLGKLLFHDPRLSSSGSIACVSCHSPELAWTDNLTRSMGHALQTGKRNAMTIMNVGHSNRFFWDGRAETLEEQARFPINDRVEMNEDLPIAVDKVAAIQGYKPYFKKAFGSDLVTLQRIKEAIATFERGINSDPLNTRFDRFISGKKQEFSDEELLGLHLFRTKAGCINCHNSPYFSDNQFHNDGQALYASKKEDLGLYYVTNNMEDRGKFKTPTLREVARTGPWMHHGHFVSLLDVVQFYNLGNPEAIPKRFKNQHSPEEVEELWPKKSPMLKKLDLSGEEIDAVIAFMRTLSSPARRMRSPELPK